MERLLVIRFGALGDLCLTGWFLTALGRRGRREVTLVTKERFAPLARLFPAVHTVEALPEPGRWHQLLALAGRLRRRRWDRIVDAHAVLRSRLLLLAMRRRPRSRLAKDTLDRWLRIAGRRHGPAPHLLERLTRLVPGTPVAPPPLPSSGAPLSRLAGPAPRQGVALAPGARWETKRWPDSKFHDLLQRLVEDRVQPVTVIVGPDEQAWFPGSDLERLARAAPGVSILAGADLPTVARRLAAHRVTVTNDSGLLHLSEATGTPVVALFGPTVRAFGYTPVLACSRLLEVDLPCRPCSRTGSRPCHRGDLACLDRIAPAAVHRHVRELLAAPGGDA